MNRFDREFHQSDFERFKLCPRMLYYREIVGIEAEKTSEFALAGSAMHETCLKAHTEKLWDEKTLFEFWREDFEKRVAGSSRMMVNENKRRRVKCLVILSIGSD